MKNEYNVDYCDTEQSYIRLLNPETALIPEKVIKLRSVSCHIRLVPDVTQSHHLGSTLSGIDVLGVIEGATRPIHVTFGASDSEYVTPPNIREVIEALAELLDCDTYELCPEELDSFHSELVSISHVAASVMVEHIERMEAAAMDCEE